MVISNKSNLTTSSFSLTLIDIENLRFRSSQYIQMHWVRSLYVTSVTQTKVKHRNKPGDTQIHGPILSFCRNFSKI